MKEPLCNDKLLEKAMPSSSPKKYKTFIEAIHVE